MARWGRSKADVLYQAEQAECGLVSIAMLASAHGLRHDLASMRARYPTSLKGLTLKAMVDIARDLGLDTRAVRCEIEDLDQIRLPAVLHWRMSHFVVLIGRRGKRWIINDPAVGRIAVRRSELDEAFTGVALEGWPSATFQRGDRRKPLRISQIIPRIPGIGTALASIFVFALGIEAITLIIPMLQQLIIDNALVTADHDLLLLLALVSGIFLVGQAATVAIRGLAQRNLTSSLSLVVPSHVFRHLLSLPTDWFERRSAADILNRIESSNVIHRTQTTSVVTAGVDGIVAVLTLGMMVVYSPMLAGIVFAAFVGYAVLRTLWYSAYRDRSAGSLVESSAIQTLQWETLRGISTIKLFNGTSRRHSDYIAALSRYVRLQNSITTTNTGFQFGHDMIFAVERVAIVFLGAKAVLAGQLSVGMLIAFLGFRENFVGKVTRLVNTMQELRLLRIHLDRLSDVLQTEPEKKLALPYIGDRDVAGAIEIRDVSYRYGEHDADVLKDCSLKVEAGEIVALVGPSGAGKSTLFKVLTGQARPRGGDVLVDGLSISAIGLEQLRNLIGVVRQDDMLFAGTISENIAFLDETPDHQRIHKAAAKAHIRAEIERMPMGFNTLIGSMGTGLSGGQAQRLMLARALYREPKILLLDEATSSLDVQNERGISAALRDLKITQVIIAHRPETIALADRVVDIREINGRKADRRRNLPTAQDQLAG